MNTAVIANDEIPSSYLSVFLHNWFPFRHFFRRLFIRHDTINLQWTETTVMMTKVLVVDLFVLGNLLSKSFFCQKAWALNIPSELSGGSAMHFSEWQLVCPVPDEHKFVALKLSSQRPAMQLVNNDDTR